MDIGVRIVGLEELKRKLGGTVLKEPELQQGMQTIAKRFERGGKGMGARNNTVTSSRYDSAASLRYDVATTLRSPRRKGSAWVRKQTAIFRAMSPRVIRSVIKKIQARWAN